MGATCVQDRFPDGELAKDYMLDYQCMIVWGGSYVIEEDWGANLIVFEEGDDT